MLRVKSMYAPSTLARSVLVCLVLAVGLLVAPTAGLAKTRHNATLVHVGPTGLESYNAWTGKSATLVHGMLGRWYYPVLSPHGLSAVTMGTGRTDRAYSTNMFGSVISRVAVPFELTFPDADGWVGMTTFEGWLDDYTAVYQQPDPNDPSSSNDAQIARDTRTGSWSYYNGAVTYPRTARTKTSADKTYAITVSKAQVMTVRVRKTKKLVARFRVPGAGNGKSETGWYYADASISPDGSFIAYELWRTPVPFDSDVTWRTYVCTSHGKSARRLKNDNGGYVWK